MNRTKIILADTDEIYLSPLETKFLEELWESAEFEVITEQDYFNEFFSEPRSADILVVSETLYSDRLKKHNISKIFVLTESMEANGRNEGYIGIYKYTSIGEIYHQIMATSPELVKSETGRLQRTRVIAVTSASGGVGKTTVALGLSACMAKKFYKVLYIDAEILQSFHYHMSAPAALPHTAPLPDFEDRAKLFEWIKPLLCHEHFDYLPPFGASLDLLGMALDFFVSILEAARSSDVYDVIIVDTDTSMNQAKAKLLTMADKAVMVVTQSPQAVFSMNLLMKNVNCSDGEKFCFVCNKFLSTKENALISAKVKPGFIVSEYIHYTDMLALNELAMNQDLDKLAFLLM